MAIDAATGEGVGVARYVRVPDDHARAEVACTVVDPWQHRGVGSALAERLATRAAEIREASVLQEAMSLSRSGGSSAWPSRASGRRLSRPVRTPAAAVALARDDRDRREGRVSTRSSTRCGERGYTVDRAHACARGAIVYDELRRAADLPAGWVDVQEGGTLPPAARATTTRCSRHTVGHDSLKRFLFPPAAARLARAARRRRRARGRGARAAAALRVRRRALVRPARGRRSRTASSSATATSTPTTRRAGATRSSSRSTAAAPAGRASASRWTPARARPPASTWR